VQEGQEVQEKEESGRIGKPAGPPRALAVTAAAGDTLQDTVVLGAGPSARYGRLDTARSPSPRAAAATSALSDQEASLASVVPAALDNESSLLAREVYVLRAKLAAFRDITPPGDTAAAPFSPSSPAAAAAAAGGLLRQTVLEQEALLAKYQREHRRMHGELKAAQAAQTRLEGRMFAEHEGLRAALFQARSQLEDAQQQAGYTRSASEAVAVADADRQRLRQDNARLQAEGQDAARLATQLTAELASARAAQTAATAEAAEATRQAQEARVALAAQMARAAEWASGAQEAGVQCSLLSGDGSRVLQLKWQVRVRALLFAFTFFSAWAKSA